MDINSIIDRLNNELDKLNKIKSEKFDTNSFFTNNENFNDDFSFDDSELPNNAQEITHNDINLSDNININSYEDIEPDNKTKSLVTVKEHRLLTAQTMFKKSIRVSLKSFLISISISFLNLFI